jgi:hypothetical protein
MVLSSKRRSRVAPHAEHFVTYSMDKTAVRDVAFWQQRRRELSFWKRKERVEAERRAAADDTLVSLADDGSLVAMADNGAMLILGEDDSWWRQGADGGLYTMGDGGSFWGIDEHGCYVEAPEGSGFAAEELEADSEDGDGDDDWSL